MTSSRYNKLLVRQAIFNRKSEVCAYQLIYSDAHSYALGQRKDQQFAIATQTNSSIIVDLFTHHEMNNIIGKKRAYINFSYNQLMAQMPLLLPKNRIMVQILETMVIDEVLINNLHQLRAAGYKIALDDFLYREEIIPVIKLAHVIKIDVQSLNAFQISEQLAPLKNQFSGKLLATRIESTMQLELCEELGFDCFQGTFVNKVNPLQQRTVSIQKASLLTLLADINNPSISLESIEGIIINIPKLSQRILRLMNSAALYTGKHVTSLTDAVMQLGLVQIRNWITVFILASCNDINPDLIERTLIRAKMCELLANSMQDVNPQQAFTVGLLSSLDAVFNQPFSTILSTIHIDEALNVALIHRLGNLGLLLQYSLYYEEAQFKKLSSFALKNIDALDAYLEGIDYASSVLNITHA